MAFVRLVLLTLALLAPGAAQASLYAVHDTPEPMEALKSSLSRLGLAVSVEDQAAFRSHMRSINARAIFMYIHNEFDPEVENFLISYAEAGGRLIVLHHGMASGKMRSARWPEFLGVRILPRDHPEHPWKVLRGNYLLVKLDPLHWVVNHKVEFPKTVSYTPSDTPSAAQQLPAIELPDTELFHDQLFTDGRRKTVLLGMKGEIDGQVVMQDRGGWLMPAGKGWVFHFQPGHFARDFTDPNYARILANAVEWKPPASPGRD
jgi:hypothetical protein